eukprot:TRINITY_DN13682_c0_g1_i1.p1 TRINITY_DN13682_c0_g1~~TRINITY_DN13682_c0_g1_i1.p1  ORF type:complete len:1534 (+),score=295.88 TRINITY_DN13682_c0_g1_i1:365-4603(+)
MDKYLPWMHIVAPLIAMTRDSDGYGPFVGAPHSLNSSLVSEQALSRCWRFGYACAVAVPVLGFSLWAMRLRLRFEQARRELFLVQYRAAAKVQHFNLLLGCLLPTQIVEPYFERCVHLQGGGLIDSPVAERIPQGCVLFAAIDAFDDWTRKREPLEVLRFLNELFSAMDQRCLEMGLVKIETVGEVYVVASGIFRKAAADNASTELSDTSACLRCGSHITEGTPCSCEQMRTLCQTVSEEASSFGSESSPLTSRSLSASPAADITSEEEAAERQLDVPALASFGLWAQEIAQTLDVELRLGIHCGPLVAGIIGDKLPRFRLFGDTMNAAARLEQNCPPAKMLASEAAARLIKDASSKDPGCFRVAEHGLLPMKGLGDVKTFHVTSGRRSSARGGGLSTPVSHRRRLGCGDLFVSGDSPCSVTSWSDHMAAMSSRRSPTPSGVLTFKDLLDGSMGTPSSVGPAPSESPSWPSRGPTPSMRSSQSPLWMHLERGLAEPSWALREGLQSPWSGLAVSSPTRSRPLVQRRNSMPAVSGTRTGVEKAEQAPTETSTSSSPQTASPGARSLGRRNSAPSLIMSSPADRNNCRSVSAPLRPDKTRHTLCPGALPKGFMMAFTNGTSCHDTASNGETDTEPPAEDTAEVSSSSAPPQPGAKGDEDSESAGISSAALSDIAALPLSLPEDGVPRRRRGLASKQASMYLSTAGADYDGAKRTPPCLSIQTEFDTPSGTNTSTPQSFNQASKPDPLPIRAASQVSHEAPASFPASRALSRSTSASPDSSPCTPTYWLSPKNQLTRRSRSMFSTAAPETPGSAVAFIRLASDKSLALSSMSMRTESPQLGENEGRASPSDMSVGHTATETVETLPDFWVEKLHERVGKACSWRLPLHRFQDGTEEAAFRHVFLLGQQRRFPLMCWCFGSCAAATLVAALQGTLGAEGGGCWPTAAAVAAAFLLAVTGIGLLRGSRGWVAWHGLHSSMLTLVVAIYAAACGMRSSLSLFDFAGGRVTLVWLALLLSLFQVETPYGCSAMAAVAALLQTGRSISRVSGVPIGDLVRPLDDLVLPCLALVFYSLAREALARRCFVSERVCADVLRRLRSVADDLMPPSVVVELRHARFSVSAGNEDPPASLLIVHSYDSVSVLQTDLVGFTALARTLAPERVMLMLNDLFSAFDAIVGAHDAYKMETVGDAYICASGLPDFAKGQHRPEALLSLALELHAAVYKYRMKKRELASLGLRAGMHTGPVIGGVVGTTMQRYHLFGGTMHIVEKLESTAPPGSVHLSEATRGALIAVAADLEGLDDCEEPSPFDRLIDDLEETPEGDLTTSKGEAVLRLEVGGEATYLAWPSPESPTSGDFDSCSEASASTSTAASFFRRACSTGTASAPLSRTPTSRRSPQALRAQTADFQGFLKCANVP